jgi:phosphoglycolate phosphatase
MGLAKAEAVYVGDSDVDVATARNSQVDCIACTWGFRTREELLATGATTLVDAPRDLVEMVMR